LKPKFAAAAPGATAMISQRGLLDRDVHPAILFAGHAGAARLETERQSYMERLFEDTVGFSVAKIIRRILGLAHNIDFEWIEDPRLRAICEARGLRLARAMMVETPSFRTIS
jgi:5-methylthioribose kinase